VQTYLPTVGLAVRREKRARAQLATVPIGLTWTVVVVAAIGGAVLITMSPVIALIFVIGCGVFLGLAPKPAATAILLATLVPVTSGIKRGVPVPGLRVSETLIVVAAVLVLMRPTVYERARWTSLDWAVLAYTVVGPMIEIFDVVVSGRHLGPAALQTAAGPIQFLLLYRVLAVALRDERHQVLAQRALLFASLPVSALGVAEAMGPAAIHDALVSVTGTTVFNAAGYTPVPRAASVFPIWLGLAGYLLVVMVLAAALLMGGDREVAPRWALLLVLFLGFAALIASLTITITVALAGAFIYLGSRYRRLRQVLAGAGLAALVAVIVFGSLLSQRVAAQQQPGHQTGNSFLPQTLAYRVQIWRDQYVQAMSGHWATGYGPTYPPNISWAHTESGYITLLLRGGIPYLAIAGIMLWFVVARARSEGALATSAHRRALCETAAVLALLQIVINLTFPYLIDGGMPQALFVVLGILGAGQLNRGSPRPPEEQLIDHPKEVLVS
jgi:hypothetical protein